LASAIDSRNIATRSLDREKRQKAKSVELARHSKGSLGQAWAGNKKPQLTSVGVRVLVEPRGIEPLTYALRTHRSPS